MRLRLHRPAARVADAQTRAQGVVLASILLSIGSAPCGRQVFHEAMDRTVALTRVQAWNDFILEELSDASPWPIPPTIIPLWDPEVAARRRPSGLGRSTAPSSIPLQREPDRAWPSSIPHRLPGELPSSSACNVDTRIAVHGRRPASNPGSHLPEMPMLAPTACCRPTRAGNGPDHLQRYLDRYPNPARPVRVHLLDPVGPSRWPSSSRLMPRFWVSRLAHRQGNRARRNGREKGESCFPTSSRRASAYCLATGRPHGTAPIRGPCWAVAKPRRPSARIMRLEGGDQFAPGIDLARHHRPGTAKWSATSLKGMDVPKAARLPWATPAGLLIACSTSIPDQRLMRSRPSPSIDLRGARFPPRGYLLEASSPDGRNGAPSSPELDVLRRVSQAKACRRRPQLLLLLITVTRIRRRPRGRGLQQRRQRPDGLANPRSSEPDTSVSWGVDQGTQGRLRDPVEAMSRYRIENCLESTIASFSPCWRRENRCCRVVGPQRMMEPGL